MNHTDPVEINGKRWVYDPCSGSHVPEDAGRNLAAVPPAAQQRAKRNALSQASKDCAISERVDIEIRTYRVDPCDTEAVFVKHAIDRLVDCGVIADDSAKEVASVKYYASEKVAEHEEEGHLITLIFPAEVTQ